MGMARIKIGARVAVTGRGDDFDGRLGQVVRPQDKFHRWGVSLDDPPRKPVGAGPAEAWRYGVFWIHDDNLVDWNPDHDVRDFGTPENKIGWDKGWTGAAPTGSEGT